MGFKVELVPFDDQAKPDVGVANAKNMITDKDILVVIGHSIPAWRSHRPRSTRKPMLAMISPANTNPTVTDRGYPTSTGCAAATTCKGRWAPSSSTGR